MARWVLPPQIKSFFAVAGFLSTVHWLVTVGVGAVVSGLVWAFTSLPPGAYLAAGGGALIVTAAFLHWRERYTEHAFVTEVRERMRETVAKNVLELTEAARRAAEGQRKKKR